jgi:hypothetical protein
LSPVPATTSPAAPRIRIRLRPWSDEDRAYVLDSWRQSWRLSERCRRLSGSQYRDHFLTLVRDGILADPDTQVLLAVAESDPTWIWGWLCHTPGVVPTLHFGVTRRDIDVEGRPEPLPLRRLRIFSTLVSAAGVRSDLVYTSRPAERSHRQSSRKLGVEEGLLKAAKRAGITAVYRSAEEFLGRRRSRA